MGPDVTPSLTTRLFEDLHDVTLADEDSNSIPTDDVNKTILANVAMQVAPLGGQTCNCHKKPQLLAKSTTNACSAIWWPKLELIQVTPPGGQNWN